MDRMTKTANKKDRPKAAAPGGVENLSGRRIPESGPAEAAVIGSMIIKPACIEQVLELINSDAFYNPSNRCIFDAIIHLYQQNKGQVDGLLVRDELERRGVIAEIGGVQGLKRIMDSVPTTANVEYYAGILKENLLLRELIAAADEISQDAYNQADPS